MAVNQGRPPKGVDSKALGQRRDADVNKDRLVFCYANLVGHRVTVKLKDQATYEGLFHSCTLDGDLSITLKCARRLPSEEQPSGEVIHTLLVPAKDFLQISAEDVPPLGAEEEGSDSIANRGFAIDGEISKSKAPANGERELIQWRPQPGEEGSANGGLGKAHDMRDWDQFKVNEQMFGVSSTYNEDYYTTKLNPGSIPESKRKEADRIAREIEIGESHEVEHRLDGDEDEEGDFSAVTGSNAAGRKKVKNGSADESGGSALAQVPLTAERLCQHDSMSGAARADEYHREHRTKRGMITAHSPMRSPMISEMKRINALNLEPALPKLDDKTRNDWINFKQSQSRNASKPSPQAGLKEEFKQSLELLRKRENSAALSSTALPERSGITGGERGKVSSSSVDVGRSGEVSVPKDIQPGAAFTKASGSTAIATNGAVATTTPATGERNGGKEEKRSSFSFNPAAKEFSFNPQASVFTPTNASAEQPTSLGIQAQQASAPSPKAQASPSSLQFTCTVVNSDLLAKSLTDLLDPFFKLTSRESNCLAEPHWTEAVGPPCNQVLGQPNPANPMPPVNAMPGGAVPGGWQPQPQQVPGQAPPGAAPQPQRQMMPAQQGFVAQQMPPGGQPGQMYQQMYPAPQGNIVAQRPPQGGNVPMQAQPMVFNQQGQPMVQQMQQGPMGAMPKFQGQVMMPAMSPGGQFPQGFVPQQGQMQPGQRQQPLAPQMGPPHGQMMQQSFVPSQQGGKRS